MNWPFLLILVPTLCYAGTAIAYGCARNWPQATIFIGYALANCGFLAIELTRAK